MVSVDVKPHVSFPSGSSSRGGDVAVYVFEINQPRWSTPFFSFLFLSLFLSLWPFRLYFIPYILPQTPCFFTLFFRSYICLIGPFNYISLYESLPQPWCNTVCLTGLKAPTNKIISFSQSTDQRLMHAPTLHFLDLHQTFPLSRDTKCKTNVRRNLRFHTSTFLNDLWIHPLQTDQNRYLLLYVCTLRCGAAWTPIIHSCRVSKTLVTSCSPLPV